MEKVKVIIEWASDGTISAMMEKDMFAGMGDTVEAAVADMKEGVALYIKTAKEMGFPTRHIWTERMRSNWSTMQSAR